MERLQREHPTRPGEQRPAKLFQAVAEHVIQNNDWCPSLKLVFAAFHSLVNDVGDQPQEGDLADLSHAYAAPYVDYYLTDRRLATRLERGGGHLLTKIVRKLPELLESLQRGA